MNHTIAIIIPAFKAQYFEETLKSIVNQTDKNFHVYIGDDNSPEDLEQIVNKFSKKIPLTYKKFKTNIGGNDLIKHWERCFELKKDEEYFIMFSDDDVMSSDYIQKLNETINHYPTGDVFHFNLLITDAEGNVLHQESKKGIYNSILTSKEFYLKLASHQITARMPDFAFKSDTFNGFVNFPLAMRSDNATVIKSSLNSGIIPVRANLYWRSSNKNISSNILQKGKIKELLIADFGYQKWIKSIFNLNKTSIYSIIKRVFINNHMSNISLKERFSIYNKCQLNLFHYIYCELLLKYYNIRKSFK